MAGIQAPKLKVSTPKISSPKISTPKINTKLSVPHPRIKIGKTGYESNKPELKIKIEKGSPPWVVAWADDVAEKDVLNGVVSAGVSIASSNPGPFIAWISELVKRTISSLKKDASKKFPDAIQNEVTKLAADIIREAITGKVSREVFKPYDTVDFKAGAIKYSGKNLVAGKTISTTWGMKPYIAFRVK